MEIVPYESFGAIRLGVPEGVVITQLGAPTERRTNASGETELDYQRWVVRVDQDAGVVEITARPEEVVLAGDHISRHDLPSHLPLLDPNAREKYGFVISPKWGVAVDTDAVNDGWITVFARGRWDEFIREP